MGIIAIIILVLMAFCALRESKVTGLYRAFGVYGRVAAYFSLFCPIGIGAFIASFFMEDSSWAERGGALLVALFGAFFYWNALRKCPSFLRIKCIPSMFISGVGVCLKICLFFIGAVWRVTGPKEVTNSSGQVLYVYDHNVYSPDGTLVGKASPDNTSYTPIQQ